MGKTLAQYVERTDDTLKNLASMVKSLEVQIGQIASTSNTRSQEALPSDTEIPQRPVKEHYNVHYNKNWLL